VTVRLALFVVVSAAGLLACDPPGTTCPNDLPSSCSSSPPTYSQVAPIFQAKCQSCHSAGGTAPDRLFDTYDQIAAQQSATLDQIYSCKMPPAGFPTLSDAERQLVLSWLVCSPLPR
jgi:uncharacterized membrane protein